MQKRAAKARRVVAAQQQLHRIEQWKLAELQRKLGELTDAQVALIGALNDSDALHGLFIDTMARRLGTLAEEAGRVTRNKNDQALRTNEHAVRVRMASRLAETVNQALDREVERKELMEVIDQFLTSERTRLP